MQIKSAFVFRQANQDGQLTKNNFLIHPCISSFYLFFKKVLVGDLFLLPEIEEAF
jgi:hypothetical protein